MVLLNSSSGNPSATFSTAASPLPAAITIYPCKGLPAYLPPVYESHHTLADTSPASLSMFFCPHQQTAFLPL